MDGGDVGPKLDRVEYGMLDFLTILSSVRCNDGILWKQLTRPQHLSVVPLIVEKKQAAAQCLLSVYAVDRIAWGIGKLAFLKVNNVVSRFTVLTPDTLVHLQCDPFV